MASESSAIPQPITIQAAESELDELLNLEWLLTNNLGAYSSQTVTGCNTRRYHALLVAATTPPMGRIATLSNFLEDLTVDDITYSLTTNEFSDTFSPRGAVHLREFRDGAAATFLFRTNSVELLKEVVLADNDNAVAIRYTLRGGSGELRLRPLVSLRDFHHLRKADQFHQMTFERLIGGVSVEDRASNSESLFISAQQADFFAEPQWWYRIYYRKDIARGQDGYEDLYSPGVFTCELADGESVQITASLSQPCPIDFDATVERRRKRLEGLAQAVETDNETARRLAMASDEFVVQRPFPGQAKSSTTLAGYHWFADWGRDSFIALPGLLLATGRIRQAKEVFTTFARNISAGMIPNRFDDYTSAAHYNSIDASMWFAAAAERFMQSVGDEQFWKDVLMPAVNSILTGYSNGTRFGIRANSDGLLTGGDVETQLTWMDAKLGEEVVTPRHGKAVEVNALWYCAHRMMAERCKSLDSELADSYADRAEMIGKAFVRTFWNEQMGFLNDCICDGTADASLRPNQIFAVSLPHSPLSPEQQKKVVDVVREKLLVPLGLRTLSPDDKDYRGRYGGSWESRDRSYHQGTAWAWLMGPFIEAYLKVENNSPEAIRQAEQWLGAFEGHLREAGLGTISEIFDGDAPHTPRGCIAQAWSVGEVLRAMLLVEKARKAAKP